MPRGDGTGPEGAGPMTGRKAGHCAGHPRAGWQNPNPGRFGGAVRRGRGFHGSPRGLTRGRKFRGTLANREALQTQRDALRSELDHIEQQLSALDAKEEKK